MTMLASWLRTKFQTLRRWFARAKSPKRRPYVRKLCLKTLEPRRLMAVWSPAGPAPELEWAGDKIPVTGRISSIAISNYVQDGVAKPAMYIGTAGGGVLRSTSFMQAPKNITWTILTDHVGNTDLQTGVGSGTIDVGSIAVLPGTAGATPTQAKLFVGTGEATGADHSRYGSGILVSPTAGDGNWAVRSTATINNPDPAGPATIQVPAFFRHSISKILIDPLDPNYVYAAVMSDGTGATTSGDSRPKLAAENGFYRSTNGGVDWEEMTENGPDGLGGASIGDGVTITDLDYRITADSHVVLYAGVRAQ